MKCSIFAIIILALTSCGPNSSPEGRMTIKIDSLQIQVNILSVQQKELKDSLAALRLDLQNNSR